MKTRSLVTLVLMALALSGCLEPKPGPIKGKPQPHGASNQGAGTERLMAGQFVVTVIDNASFFNAPPEGEVLPDLFLMRGVSCRVIAPGNPYTRVELDDGRIGYIMSAMLVPQAGGEVPAGGGAVEPVPVQPPAGMPELLDPGLPPVSPWR